MENQAISNQPTKLQKLFEEELKAMYWAEQKLVDTGIPGMIENASSPNLKSALNAHLTETKTHVSRIEQIFRMMGQDAETTKCEAMAGLIDGAEDIMDDIDEGPARDAGIITAAQKVEHYEIATYGSLRNFAETLGLTEVASLLNKTLDEEKEADQKLNQIAVSEVNQEALAEVEED